MSTIAATTTRAGLTVTAELDTGRYPRGVKISDTIMGTLPLSRHGWHGEWNYTLAPQPVPPPAAPPLPAARPLLDLHWLAHPALTGLTSTELAALATAIGPGWHGRREQCRYQWRGGPRRYRPGSGGQNRRLDLTGSLLVTALNRHLSVPQHAIAALLGTDQTTIGRAIRDIRHALGPAITIIPAAPTRLHSLTDLHTHAATHGTTLPPTAKTAS